MQFEILTNYPSLIRILYANDKVLILLSILLNLFSPTNLRLPSISN